MKKPLRFLAFLIVGLAIITTVLIWLGSIKRSELEQRELVIAEENARRNAENADFRRKVDELKKKKGAAPSLEDVLMLLPERARAYYRLAFDSLEEIGFYGRVIDQHGRPVQGATVTLDVSGKFLAGGSQGWLMSNEAGMFNVSTEGGAFFSVRSIVHPSCYFVSPARTSSDQIVPLAFYGHQPTHNASELLWTDFTDENRPYDFKVWCIDELEEIQSAKTGFGVPMPDGRLYTIDLYKKYSYDAGEGHIHEGDVPGHFYIKMFQDAYPVGFPSGEDLHIERNWWLELAVQGGGLIEVKDDVYMNEAPVSGYQERLRISKVQTTKESFSRPERYFYFKAHGGKEYGALVVRFTPLSQQIDGLPGLTIKYKMNNNGSRNLVLKDWQPTVR